MDETPMHVNPTPWLKANVVSRLLYWWLNPLFKIGYKRRIEEDDLYNVTRDEQSEFLGNKLESDWQEEVQKSNNIRKPPSLHWSLFRTFGRTYMLYGLLLLFEEATVIIQPILLSGLIRYFTTDSHVSVMESYMYAAGVGICAFVLAFTHHPYYLGVQTIGMRMKIACSSMVYKKSLKLNSEGRRQTSTGQIVNILSNDVRNFGQLMTMLHFLWIGPLEVIVVLVVLWLEIGPPAIAGFLVIFAMAPLLQLIGKLLSKYRKKSAAFRDDRIGLVSEIITAMRVVKLYCWEIPFGEDLKEKRRKEVDEQRKLLRIHFIQDTLTFVSKLLFLLPVIFWMMLASIDLRASTIFLAIRIYDHAGLTVLRRTVRAFTLTIQTRVSVNRIKKFLLLEEQTRMDTTYQERPCSVDIDIKSAKWQHDSDCLTLEDVSARVESGNLLTIHGPVGAGKSSILMAILRELPVLDGAINVSGRLAYASQQPWVFSGTVRQNILFGKTFEKKKYEEILKSCALDKDMEIMPDGDQTLVGDRGVILSGGQKSRIGLARALYADADIYLLDDPLSAADSIVGKHIFQRVIRGVLRKKITILVTHQLHFLDKSDNILVLSQNGKMIGKGTREELEDAEIIQRDRQSEDHTASPYESPGQVKTESGEVIYSRGRETQDEESERSPSSTGPEFKAETPLLPKKEERREKTVKANTYFHYVKAGAGPVTMIIAIIAFLATQGSFIFCDWWLAYWTDQEEEKYAAIANTNMSVIGNNITHTTIPDVDTHFNFGVLSGVTVAVIVFCLLRAYLFFKMALDSSQNLHNTMFASVLGTRIGFFDADQSTGRILNRFSKDIRQLDDTLPRTFYEFLQCALLVFGIVIVAGISVPWVYIVLLPLAILFVMLKRYYVRTANHIRRLQGTTLSPVNGHVAKTLEGITTIRAFGMQKRMIEIYDCLQDLHTEATALSLTSARWFAVRLDLLCAIFVLTVSLACVLAGDRPNAGIVGLSITYSMSLMALFQWCVRQNAEVETQMVAVERVVEYTKLPPEPTHGSKPPSDWPQKGEIVVQDGSLKYSEDRPVVLKNLKFTIKENEKVGIVGRTGAGKSSLITMLFRLVEPTGCIKIDDVNIQEITLQDLRGHISIIPQDPVLFSGTLRKNIDRFGKHKDEDIWNALDNVELKKKVENLPERLEYEVTEGGGNFSVGERQLICLARAILRKNKILVIDEATANVDNETDRRIQYAIRQHFSDCTVLTIAHRLLTVMDCDKILVLDDGNVVEFDEPHLLLQNADGLLLKMVEETRISQHLKDRAREAYKKRHA